MPKPRVRAPRKAAAPKAASAAALRRRYTDHRAAVLEEIATAPYVATRDAVQKAVMKMGMQEFHANAVSAMVSELLRVGLVGRKEDGTLFLTQVGLDILQHGDFTRPLPAEHEKPNRRGKKYGPRKKRST
jgi:hypothetical protein